MPFISALIWAACCAGAQAAVIQHKILPYQSVSNWLRWGLVFASALTAAVGGWFAPLRAPLLSLPRLLLIMAVLSCASGVDLTRRRIPNLFSLILLAGLLTCTLLDFLLRPAQAAGILASGLLGGVGMLAVLGLCRLVSRGGIGMGDIKLLSSMALLLGLYGGIHTLLYAQLAALIYAVAMLVSHRATWKDSVPFAPFFWAGFLLCLMLGTY